VIIFLSFNSVESIWEFHDLSMIKNIRDKQDVLRHQIGIEQPKHCMHLPYSLFEQQRVVIE
jgi:hypothetical protein